MALAAKKSDSSVDRVYRALHAMAANFEFKPDQRINESQLALELGASRTPLREALNRLVAEGLLNFKNGQGFFCRTLSPKKILDLYETRVAIETEIVRLACERATDDELSQLEKYLDKTEPAYNSENDPQKLLEMDEDYHLRIAELSQNRELVRTLKSLNDRVRYVRLIDLKSLRSKNPISSNKTAKLSAHRVIFQAIQKRNATQAVDTMRRHIERRREEATEAVRIAYSQLYVPTD